jgi:hypothetical protein
MRLIPIFSVLWLALAVLLGCDNRFLAGRTTVDGSPSGAADDALGGGGTGGSPVGGSGGTTPPSPVVCGLVPAPLSARPLLISPEVAVARLTRLLWGPGATAPAAYPPLLTSADVGLLAEQMLGQRRDGAVALLERWLGVADFAAARPDASVSDRFSEELRASMITEAHLFLDDQLAQGGTLRTLLGADYTFVDERLSGLYQLSPVSGSAFVKESFPAPVVRSGVLTQAGRLFATARPSRRGRWVKDALQCSGIPAPPVSPDSGTVPDGPGSYRQRLEQQTSQPQCYACHALIDPVGFALEHFDPLGGYRAEDNLTPVDASGKIILGGYTPSVFGNPVVEKTFDGAPQLAGILSDSCDVQLCAARSVLGAALGQADLHDGVPQKDQEVSAAFIDAGFGLAKLFVIVAQSQRFLAP